MTEIENDGKRFKVVLGSESGHCCFGATIIDTQKPYLIDSRQHFIDGKPAYDNFCEFFDEEDAKMVCGILNAHFARS